MPIVEVNGQEIEFPDDMPQEQIRSVLQKKFTQNKPELTAFQKADTTQTGRMLHGMGDAVYGVSQLAPRMMSEITSLGGTLPNKMSEFYDQDAQRMDAQAAERAKSYDMAKRQMGVNGFDAMRALGNIASPSGAVVGKAATMLPKAGSFLSGLAQNAAIGGVGAAISPVEDTSQDSFASQKLKQMGTGAATAGLINAAGSSLASIINPTVSDDAKKLLDEGVRLTPGQIRGGWFKSIEDKATSIPLLGDAIKSAQRRGYEDMNKAVANRALAPIGQRVPDDMPAGRDMVAHVADTLGERYDQILPKMRGVVDEQLMTDVSRIGSKAQMTLPEQQLNVFKNIVKSQFAKKTGSEISGEELKDINSFLSQEAAGYKSDPSHDNRKLGEVISELNESMKGMLKRNNSPELTSELHKTDLGWANFVRLRKASGSLGAHDGVFTPAQLQSAVRSSEKSVGNGKFARGENLMQDLSDPAKNILPSSVPDSGSAGRALFGLAATGGAGLLSAPAAAAGLAATGIYTRPGVAMMEALLTKRPDLAEPISRAIRAGTSPEQIARLLFGTRAVTP